MEKLSSRRIKNNSLTTVLFTICSCGYFKSISVEKKKRERERERERCGGVGGWVGGWGRG
jgi:hypothetical protein